LNKAATPIRFTATITGLSPGTAYSLLRYDDYATLTSILAKSPFPGYLAAGGFAQRYNFTASSSIQQLTDDLPIMSSGLSSNGTYFYRCIKSA
jgi:hypothetical protein